MSGTRIPDWDPRSAGVLADQLHAYDAMRQHCPIAWSDYLHWTLFRHADVLQVLRDHATFGNAASGHPSVPNGLDPPQHTHYRRIIEPYFGADRMAAFEPVCRDVARSLLARLPEHVNVDAIAALALPFALHIQCAFMGWPVDIQATLQAWVLRSQQATLDGDRPTLDALARQFDELVAGLLAVRRDPHGGAPDDVTTALLRETVAGQPIETAALASLLRNWTVGEVGTIAASVGILIGHLVRDPALQAAVRADRAALPAAIDELLRMDAPLLSNRRVTTRPVRIGDRDLPAGAILTLLWASANRDETVFGDPDAFRPEHNALHNLLYGAGIHVCPGAPLARLELRVVMEELLATFERIVAAPVDRPVRARYPAGGFSYLPVALQRAAGNAESESEARG
jgi:cytochrome P450